MITIPSPGARVFRKQFRKRCHGRGFLPGWLRRGTGRRDVFPQARTMPGRLAIASSGDQGGGEIPTDNHLPTLYSGLSSAVPTWTADFFGSTPRWIPRRLRKILSAAGTPGGGKIGTSGEVLARGFACPKLNHRLNRSTISPRPQNASAFCRMGDGHSSRLKSCHHRYHNSNHYCYNTEPQAPPHHPHDATQDNVGNDRGNDNGDD